MLACKCMSDSVNGKNIRNELLKRMWEDVNNRMDKLGVSFLYCLLLRFCNIKMKIFFSTLNVKLRVK